MPGEDTQPPGRPHGQAGARQAAADLEEARVVRTGAHLSLGLCNALDLVGEDSRRRLGVLDCERASEAAAFGGVRKLEELEAFDRSK